MKRILKILKKIKLRTLILLIILLIFNSYAWFIFITKASSQLDVHVSSWKIRIRDNQTEFTENVTFNVDRVYPGMTDYRKTIEIENLGETDATFSYEIQSVTILGTTYETDATITSAELERKIREDFPFSIQLSTNNETVEAEDGKSNFTISVVWPFESGDDETDTYWGNQAYEYCATHTGQSCITVVIKLIATQS